MIARDAQVKLLEMAQKFWVVALLGPRQSGKTTLAQMTFPEYEYISLENIATRGLAAADPMRFLEQFRGARGVIFDEIQHVPELLSYIQVQVDKEKKFGFFIITGSQNFLLNQAISQTLAGRIFIIKLLPLSLHELISGITYFNELAHQKDVPSFVVYAGDDYIPLTPGTLVGWKHLDKIPVG
jgi:predicted AAA+ superfamily ATPase